MFDDLLSRWPLIQQIKTGADGTGPEAMSIGHAICGPSITARKWRGPSVLIVAWAVDSWFITKMAS